MERKRKRFRLKDFHFEEPLLLEFKQSDQKIYQYEFERHLKKVITLNERESKLSFKFKLNFSQACFIEIEGTCIIESEFILFINTLFNAGKNSSLQNANKDFFIRLKKLLLRNCLEYCRYLASQEGIIFHGYKNALKAFKIENLPLSLAPEFILSPETSSKKGPQKEILDASQFSLIPSEIKKISTQFEFLDFEYLDVKITKGERFLEKFRSYDFNVDAKVKQPHFLNTKTLELNFDFWLRIQPKVLKIYLSGKVKMRSKYKDLRYHMRNNENTMKQVMQKKIAIESVYKCEGIALSNGFKFSPNTVLKNMGLIN